MNTWVLCFRRRNALECTIRSRSRWKGVRWSESDSESSRTAGYERVASGESDSSSRSIRSLNEVRASWAMAPRLSQFTQRPTRSRPRGCGARRGGSPLAKSRLQRASSVVYAPPSGSVFASSRGPLLRGCLRCLRRRHARDRHPVGRAAHVVEAAHLKERDRLRIASVFAADAELQVGLRLAAGPGCEPHEPADARSVDRLERAAVQDLGLDVAVEEAPLHVVAREPERCLREVVGSEREEVGVGGYPVRHEAGARQLDHRADREVEVRSVLL